MTEWSVFLFILAGRFFDVFSTRMVTPTLLLEGNHVAKKLGWIYAWSTLLVAFIAFWQVSVGIIIGTLSCLMGWSNMSFVLLSRYATGEEGLKDLYVKAFKNCSVRDFLVIQIFQFLPLLVLSYVILGISGFSLDNHASDVGYGILAWLLILAVHKSRFIVFKMKSRRNPQPQPI
jgi:hypothetical protein